MTLRWERFAGDTSAFAVKVSFHHDPDRGHGAPHDVAQSWGALQLWVRGTNLCAHVDQGETLQAAHWYLLSLLEWFAANWDPILHEQRPPSGMRSIVAATDVSSARMASESWSGPASLDAMESRYEWQQRHSLRSARDGGILPDVRFRRLADRVEISWRDSPLAGAEEISFVSAEDVVYEAPSAVAEPLYEVLHSAATWLRQQVPESERTAALLETVKALRSPDRANERTAWLAGLALNARSTVDRWSALKDTLRPQADADVFDVVFGTGRSSDVVISGSCEAALLFGSLDPEITDDDATRIARLLLETYARNPRDGLADLVVDESIDSLRRPWEQGYELADDLRDDANLPTNGSSTDIEGFLVSRGVQILDEDLSDRNPDLLM